MELRGAGSAGHVVIGGGVHGLSVAWRLAERGADVLVLEKDRIGSGASGVAGGIVRNFYRPAAISDLIRRSVEMWSRFAPTTIRPATSQSWSWAARYADDILEGESGLEPFRLARFERGETHAASKGPYPWT